MKVSIRTQIAITLFLALCQIIPATGEEDDEVCPCLEECDEKDHEFGSIDTDIRDFGIQPVCSDDNFVRCCPEEPPPTKNLTVDLTLEEICFLKPEELKSVGVDPKEKEKCKTLVPANKIKNKSKYPRIKAGSTFHPPDESLFKTNLQNSRKSNKRIKSKSKKPGSSRRKQFQRQQRPKTLSTSPNTGQHQQPSYPPPIHPQQQSRPPPNPYQPQLSYMPPPTYQPQPPPYQSYLSPYQPPPSYSPPVQSYPQQMTYQPTYIEMRPYSPRYQRSYHADMPHYPAYSEARPVQVYSYNN
ncbi:adhesive plaque matrix protein-like [Artemia franciscana]|uniref:adhesive plaque matrix protein-like n=1 Tax=Artemia franciscana TaxID=6661 RepID=UPI0032DA2330